MNEQKGKETEKYLLSRHEIIYKFLSWLGNKNSLEETERIEHSISKNTVEKLNKLMDYIEKEKIKTDFNIT